jgi:glycosyltransferase involved in cell wall biosynthesis
VAGDARERAGVPSIELVVPCYNEALRLDAAAFRRAGREVPAVRFRFVDDGSGDDTLSALERICREEPGLGSVLGLPHNRGKAEAVRQGMQAALDTGPDFVGYWDADLATPLDELPRFRELLLERPETDIVLGSRVRLLGRDIDRSPVRHYLGRVFATAASMTLGLPVYDTQCGAKLFRTTPVLREVIGRPFLTRWVFDVEILARYRMLRGEDGVPVGRRIYELPLERWTDVPGSKVRPLDFVRSGLELVRIWNAYVRRRVPKRPGGSRP